MVFLSCHDFSSRYLFVDVFNLWAGGPFVYPGMNSIFLYIGHEVCQGYFPFAWKPFSDGHSELLFMNIWATSIWVFVSYCLHKANLFMAI